MKIGSGVEKEKTGKKLLKEVEIMGTTTQKLKEQIFVEELMMFEDNFQDGVFAVSHPPNMPKMKVKALLDYCKQHGKGISELSKEEIEQLLD